MRYVFRFQYIGVILLACLLLIGAMYLFVVRDWVIALYNDQASDTLKAWVGWLYPRFFTEKHRFSLAFFLQKTDQMMLRLGFVGIVLFVWRSFFPAFLSSPTLSVFKNSSSQIVFGLRVYFSLLALFFTWDWYFELCHLQEARAFYSPVFLLRLFGLPFPTVQASLILCLLLWISAVGVSVGKQASVYFAGLFFVLFVVLQGYQMSFHKIDHHFALFTYWAFLMPFLLASVYAVPKGKIILPDQTSVEIPRQAQRRLMLQDQHFWIFLMQLSVALPYTIAGLEKILIGGLGWFQPYTLQAYLHLHAQPWGLWVAKSEILCGILSVGMLLWETFFVLVVFFAWARWVFLPAGILFHLGTYLLLGAGAWIHPWWLCYGIFFFSVGKEK